MYKTLPVMLLLVLLMTLVVTTTLAGTAYAADEPTVVLPAPPSPATDVAPDTHTFKPFAADTLPAVPLSDAQDYSDKVDRAIAKVAFDNLPGFETGIVTGLFTGELLGNSGVNLSRKLGAFPNSWPILGNRALFVTFIGVDTDKPGFNIGFNIGLDVSLSRLDQKDYGLRAGACVLREGGDGGDIGFEFYLRQALINF